MADSPRALPYGLHRIEADDVAAVREALRANLMPSGQIADEDLDAALSALTSGQITQGPRVAAFENAFAAKVGAARAVACASGTAALQIALTALDVGPGDLCVAPAISFLSTATAARLCGAGVVFADVDPLTGLMTAATLADAAERACGPIKVALPVHLGGRLCDMPEIAETAARIGASVVEDACHALGSSSLTGGMAGEGRYSRATAFSFHPVKTIACGEGGMVTTDDPALAARMARLRNHGVTRELGDMTDPTLSLDCEGQVNPWSYEQLELGFNYRMTEIEAALGLSQLGKLDRFVERRRDFVDLYDQLLAPLAPLVEPVMAAPDDHVSPHLYAVRIDFGRLTGGRVALMRRLASKGIGTQVHYIPIYRQPYFVNRYGPQRLPGAEAWYASTLSLPLFPAMEDSDVHRTMLELTAAVTEAI